MNQCAACNEDFNSVRLFDAHRVGEHAYTFDPEHPDGRRCLDIEETKSRGWTLNERGRWIDPVEVARGVSALHRSREAQGERRAA